MPINIQKKFIYIHIPKCSGTRINKLFGMTNNKILYSSNNTNLGKTKQQFTFNEIIKVLNNNNLNILDYYIFTVVRNPYARFFSAYNQYPNNCNIDFKKMINNMNIKEFAKYLLNRIKNEGYDFFNYDSFHQFQPSIFFIEKNNFHINIIKMEYEYNKNIQTLCKKFNIDYDNNLYVNKISNKNVKEYYADKELCNIIFEIYKADFEYLKYNK
tara:strand:- start:3036 stop:3674 length:639 start_codon:yes stop_codon:yes gene_type:complete